MPEQWMNPATWGGAQWLVMALLIVAVLAMAAVIHRLIGMIQSEMQKKRQRPVLRPNLRPDLRSSATGDSSPRKADDEKDRDQ